MLSTVDVTKEVHVAEEFENIKLDVKPGIKREEILKIVENYEGIIAGDIIEYDLEVFEKAPGLRIITRFGIGVDNVDLEDATESGVMVTNVPGENAESVAEHAIGLMISSSKNFYRADGEIRRGNWRRSTGRGRELAGKTLGQVGFGNIGSLVARKCRLAFGMDLLVYDPYVPKHKIESEFGKKCEFEELLRKSDVISINAPLTEETRNMFGRRQFEKMKDSAILVNTARGEIIKEGELAKALKQGELYAAGLDVLREEPAKENNPLFDLEHVTITPHSANVTFEAWERILRKALNEQKLAFQGKRPEFLLNEKVMEKL
ncbi:hypothetical protein AKJ65_02890 [candidate division MSBL1 archaeon SCGC-AAA259E19]|uniref:3-phosphoglycerate dehydrogenase n=1 Tax=candidate division MSBL1 archaeon SCGC-AAA259E19 TaxID=1698264 RepID=A0A133ULD4_9EURY|nr:hypothetical protein AKJ65_02890 [candidate division MSBL1 archaeon SCGC-AAA259E19]